MREYVATPVSAAIVDAVHALERGELAPGAAPLARILAAVAR